MESEVQQELTHDEVWDDSTLVDSWNEALEEYKKYHSLASRGEKVETPLKSKAEAHLTNNDASTTKQSSNAPINFIGPARPSPTTQAVPGASIRAATSSTAPPPPPSAPSGLANLPQNLLGSSQDESLRNIMMSWYYAGYYTGLYEGQQKAWADMQNAQETG